MQTETARPQPQEMLPLDMFDLDTLRAELRRHINMAKDRGREHSLAVLPCNWVVLERLLARLDK